MSNHLKSWQEVSLYSLCKPKQWPTIPQNEFTENGYPVYGANGRIGYYNEFNHEKPTVLITCRGATCGTINICEPKSYVTGNSMALDELDETRVSLKFLVYVLRHRGLTKAITGTAQPQITRESLTSIMIPLPSLNEQRRIAAILDKADGLRAKRRAVLTKLDTLTQSIFLDMFGDPATNPKGWPIKTLAEFYVNKEEGTKCGPFGSALKKDELESEGVPVWNMDNIDAAGRMVLPFRMWISESKYRQLESYAVADGDVIVSRAGTVGKMCVVITGSAKSIISTNLIRLRFGPGLLPQYFVSLMTYCKGRVGRLKTGADGTLTHMNTGILDTLIFPYPPVEKQRNFVVIVESIERQKSRYATQLAEIDMLFKTIQHRAFRGELSSSVLGGNGFHEATSHRN